ncbi:FmdB family zinc ribbon protein [uncultured Paraglaciecola sp.]|uniref:FmdB family zinc ribbon protein n=1 Tax=uncultured Paraglaciecola sp. TaxID=1765024 RepID=UPI002639C37D|nr:FmdB family zinc ribbon protein [uncultured Paraglaciecola sp.]
MPLYEYGCSTCGTTETKRSSIADRKSSIVCNDCGGTMPQRLGGVSVVCYNGPHILSTRPFAPFQTKRAMTEHMKRNNLTALQ